MALHMSASPSKTNGPGGRTPEPVLGSFCVGTPAMVVVLPPALITVVLAPLSIVIVVVTPFCTTV